MSIYVNLENENMPDTADPANTDEKDIVKVKITGKGAYKDEAITVTYR